MTNNQPLQGDFDHPFHSLSSPSDCSLLASTILVSPCSSTPNYHPLSTSVTDPSSCPFDFMPGIYLFPGSDIRMVIDYHFPFSVDQFPFSVVVYQRSYLEIKKEINLTEEAEKLQGKSITFEYWCDSNDSSNSKEIIVDGMNKDVKCNMKKWEKSEKYNIEKGFNKSTEFFLAIRKIEVVGEKTTECTDTDSCKRNWIFEEKNIVGKDNFIDDEFFMSVGSKGIITFANQNIKSPGKVQFDYLCFDSKDSTPRQLSDTCETFKCHSAWETQTCSFNEANKEIKVTLNHDKILLLVRKIKGDGT
ncbi:uncharacterized protein LOC111088217 [Limulus polyphemus]|uniref:Uncharacterized protein LOC111088217 n=1 Tax=Limulus polyphemus TaxID=6850 RepID=A0ABM1TBS9_LIMPO|nr:uncharacterized protein LOC111088217 [Limulus polyphemus]